MCDRKVALLDWDNTLRPGFTVIDWVTFLASRDQYDAVIVDQISSAIRSYSQRHLTYAELAELQAKLYASGLVGQAVSTIRDSAADFVIKDQANLFGFTQDFLTLLADKGIDVNIVSGCPSEVLAAYSPVLGWHKDYGLEAEHDEGYYTGKMTANRAGFAGKRQALREIMGRGQALLAAGDSISDLPLLENARIRLVFDNPQLLQSQPDTYHLDPYAPVSEILDAVRRFLPVDICQ